MVSRKLIDAILNQYELPAMGSHGLPHWARVLENGLRLAETTGANVRVVELFAVFHDSCRLDEGSDPGHGPRGADLAAALHNEFFTLDEAAFELLYAACTEHTHSRTHDDITVCTCFDADRLDLTRVNITPRPDRLCTETARDPDLIGWAVERSSSGYVPGFVREEWLRGRLPGG